MSKKLSKHKFIEKELELLRNAVDKAEHKRGKQHVNTDTIIRIIKIVEDFIKNKRLVCYGGTAINNILPDYDKFYDRSIELPDYDFFSPNAYNDAIELADLYYKHGFVEVEAKAGIHYGTYKVFVNFIPIADITQQDPGVFNAITKDAIKVKNILYSPPNYLRMAAYLELSRPAGDVSRWEKVLKRLILLNKHYPLKAENCNSKLFKKQFKNNSNNSNNSNQIFNIIKNSAINQGLVFFGGHAMHYYSQYMPNKNRINNSPNFDILAEDPYRASQNIKDKLKNANIKDINIIKKENVGEIISAHYEIIVDKKVVAYIYEPLACHSYNTIVLNGKVIKIATIDTMLSFYLAFLYANKPYYNTNRILCMAEYLFSVQAKNRLEQKGVLKRFSINCYGKQNTLETIRANKANKFKELKHKKDSNEFKTYFLRYIPHKDEDVPKRKVSKHKTTKRKTTKHKMTKRKTTKRKVSKRKVSKRKITKHKTIKKQ